MSRLGYVGGRATMPRGWVHSQCIQRLIQFAG